jgi:DnaJ-class molecular chaperone
MRYVMCPRCDGKGRIKIFHEDKFRKKVLIQGDCPVCRGTGQASLMEKMGERQQEDRRERN